MTLTVLIDLGPNILAFGDKLMSLFDDLSAKLDDLKSAAASEHEQVMAAFDALQASVTAGLTPAQQVEINTKFDEAKFAISGVFEPPATP